MIQRTDNREIDSSLVSARQDGPEVFGKWAGSKHYSLEVVQHPLRARMCGFGDKDRRPLAPAAVAKMIVRREDDSIVEVDEVDCSFFIVTVDLYSADGKQQTNLVLHPTSADRFTPSHSSKSSKGRGTGGTTPARQAGTSGNQTPAGRNSPTPGPQLRATEPATSPYANHGPYPPPPPPGAEGSNYPPGAPYGPPSSAQGGAWGYPAQPVDRSVGFPPPVLPSIHSFGRSASSSSADNWPPDSADSEVYRAWGTDGNYTSTDNNYANDDQNVDPALRTPSTATSEAHDKAPWSQSNSYSSNALNADGEPGSSFGHAPFQQVPYTPHPSGATGSPAPGPAASAMPALPRHTYTRTLVGPLSSNACRLLDEHRKPGIFFLFQDLSVRTEGTFRLRMRLMNVGAPPAPELGAQRIHNDISPVLAQTFTDAFTVFSAKRFPGVPDTTALSIALGNQGQKLPLRNRHGSSSTKRRRRGGSDSDDDTE